MSQDMGQYCTFSDSRTGFCAYHSSFEDYAGSLEPNFGVALGTTTIYAYIPSAAQHGCSSYAGANGDGVADATINIVSHEQFESVTDPDFNSSGSTGWFDDALVVDRQNRGEIGDKCVGVYGTVQSDGRNITLNGDGYLLQREWSNRVAGCMLS